MELFQPAWVKGMAMSNVIGCFRVTGIYPANGKVTLVQRETADNPPLPKPTPFLPFCTPQRDGSAFPLATESPPYTLFSRAEMEYLRSCLKESTDARYAVWLQTFHPKANGHASAQGVLDTILQRKPGEYTGI